MHARNIQFLMHTNEAVAVEMCVCVFVGWGTVLSI